LISSGPSNHASDFKVNAAGLNRRRLQGLRKKTIFDPDNRQVGSNDGDEETNGAKKRTHGVAP
jgi:hypothetical protein